MRAASLFFNTLASKYLPVLSLNRNNMPEQEPRMKSVSPIQSHFAVVSVLAALIAFICTVSWVKGTDTEDRFLGGLNWRDLVFNWHVICMVGFFCCYSMALLSYRLLPLGKPTNKSLHVFWHCAGLFCLIMGFVAVFKSHNTKIGGGGYYSANLVSLHSWLGLATVILFGQNYLLGALHYLSNYVKLDIKKAYMPYHQFFGELGFLVAFATVETGIMELNTFLSCSYSITEKDFNPAKHYLDIPKGCRISNGLGILVLLITLSVMFVLKNVFTIDGNIYEKEPLMA